MSNLLHSNIACTQKVSWCKHKHWKNCYNMPEAHMYVEQPAEEPIMRAEDQTCIAQLVSAYELLSEDDDTGSRTGTMRDM